MSDLQGLFPHLSVGCFSCSGPCSSSHILCLHCLLCPACTFLKWKHILVSPQFLHAFLFPQCFSECLLGQQSELLRFSLQVTPYAVHSTPLHSAPLLTAPSRFVSARQKRKVSRPAVSCCCSPCEGLQGSHSVCRQRRVEGGGCCCCF